MGMKYKDPVTGQLKEISLKAADTLPIGTIVDYDGQDVPEGWEEVEETEDYSTSETKTGKHWVDGKPIYRRVYNFGALPNAASKTINHNISNLRFITKQIGVAKSTNNEYIQFAPYYNTGEINMFCNQNEIAVSAVNDRSRWTETYIILEYTKTTD